MSREIPVLQCHMLDTGYCLAWEDHVIQGGEHKRIHCHSLVALLHHPEQGWFLWDTGYAPRMLEVTRTLPYSLYRRATPLRLKAELAIVEQLARYSLSTHDIRRLIISHFHADHIAGLLDFPQAEFIALQTAYQDVAWRQGIQALRRGFIPALLPADFQERATLLGQFTGEALPGLGSTYDIFGDGSLLLVELPGHARGQIGMLAHTDRGQILFAADGCWLRRSIYERRPPSRVTHFIADNVKAMRGTINNLYQFSQTCPEVIIVPSHCPEAFVQQVETYQ